MPFETDKTNGFKVDLSELLKTGAFPEAFDRRIPMWETVDGVQFTEFGMKRKAGRTEKHDFSEAPQSSTKPIRGITATREFSDKVAYIGDTEKIYSFRLSDGAVDTVGTGYTMLESAAATTWDATWDGGDTVWDEGINKPSQWSFETFGNWVVGANCEDKPVIKKNNINFNTFHDDEVSGAVVTAGGSGYSVDDDLTFTGGSGTGFTATVTEVDGTEVKAFEITNFGSGYTTNELLTAVEGNADFTCTVTVPDVDFNNVQAFHKQGPHMLAFSYTTDAADFKTSFAWCSADNLDLWQPASTNTAGSLQIREAETDIIGVAQLGNNLAGYTESQMFLVSYVGLPNIFGYLPALTHGVGAVSPNSTISVGRQNYGLSRDGFFVTDGTQVQMIGRDNGMNAHVRKNIAATEYGQVYGFHNAKEYEVVWGLPFNSTKITEEIYYNYKTGQWGQRTSGVSAYLERGVFNEALSGDKDSKFYFEGAAPTLTQEVKATTRAHDLNDADRVKELTSMRVGIEGVGSPQVRVGWSETIDATPVFNESFVVDNTFNHFDLRTSGRYLHLEVTSSGSTDDWTITDMTIIGRTEGSR